jgi:hypothetical protein
VKAIFSILALLITTGSDALADAPKQLPKTRYTPLWSDSPFTSKPPPPTAPEAANPFEGYSLGGVSKLADGYFVVLLNAKDPNENVLIRPGYKSDWEIVAVDWSKTNWRETTVKVKKGATVGTIGFDTANLAVKPPAAAQPTPNAPQAGGGNPNQQRAGNQQQGQGDNPQRPRPRRRVMAPPQNR